MHDKFAVFDHQEAITGSYNWTNNAEHNNWENALFLNDKNTVDEYEKEFKKILGFTKLAPSYTITQKDMHSQCHIDSELLGSNEIPVTTIFFDT